MSLYIKIVDAVNKVIRVIVIAMFVVMFLAAFLQVIVRNFTHFSVPWSDELCRFLIIYIVYLGAGLAARSGRLIRMEVLPMLAKMSDKGLHRFYWVAAVISLGFAVLTVYCGASAMMVNYKSLSAALKISMAIPYLAIPVGSVFMALNVFANIFELTIQDKEAAKV